MAGPTTGSSPLGPYSSCQEERPYIAIRAASDAAASRRVVQQSRLQGRAIFHVSFVGSKWYDGKEGFGGSLSVRLQFTVREAAEAMRLTSSRRGRSCVINAVLGYIAVINHLEFQRTFTEGLSVLLSLVPPQ